MIAESYPHTTHLLASFYNPDCWLQRHGEMEGGRVMPPCDGRLIKAHLIPRQLLDREFPNGTTILGTYYTLEDLLDHTATWVLACGGPMGNAGHHGYLDVARRLRVPWRALPPATIGLARVLGLDWWLRREYGWPDEVVT